MDCDCKMNFFLGLVVCCAVISSCIGADQATSSSKDSTLSNLQSSSAESVSSFETEDGGFTKSTGFGLSASTHIKESSDAVTTSSISPTSLEEEPVMTATPVITPSSTESSHVVASVSVSSSHLSSLPVTTVQQVESSSVPIANSTSSISFNVSTSTVHSVSFVSTSLVSTTFHLITPTSASESVTMPTTSVPSTTRPPVHNHNVMISETNLLLVSSQQLDKVFVELKGNPSQSLEGLYLTIRNGSDNTGIIQVLGLKGNLNEQGFAVLNSSNQPNFNFGDLRSVVVALYSDESAANKLTSDSLLHSLVLSNNPKHVVNAEVAEVYPENGKLYVELEGLNSSQDLSMSLCKGNTSSFVLTRATENKPNDCSLNLLQSLVMKLQVEEKKCLTDNLPDNFNDLIAKETVTKVNEFGQCGLTFLNIEGVKSETQCVDNKKEIFIKFHIKSVLEKQVDCVRNGYDSFVREAGTVRLGDKKYLVVNCTEQCIPNTVPSSGKDDKNIKVTVAVVITCICVFLVILLVVIIYMKRNRRGVLQFRMTRLDEDDDDLVGDMDDFVGNQRATFSNFR